VAGQGRGTEGEFRHDQAVLGQLMRQRLVACGIDAIEPGADDSHARTRTGQPAAVRGRIDAERQSADDGESGIGKRVCKGFCVAYALRGGVAAADDAECGLREPGPLALAIEKGGRVGNFKQGPRIVRIRQRHQAVAGLIQPGMRGVEAGSVGRGQQRIALGG